MINEEKLKYLFENLIEIETSPYFRKQNKILLEQIFEDNSQLKKDNSDGSDSDYLESRNTNGVDNKQEQYAKSVDNQVDVEPETSSVKGLIIQSDHEKTQGLVGKTAPSGSSNSNHTAPASGSNPDLTYGFGSSNEKGGRDNIASSRTGVLGEKWKLR